MPALTPQELATLGGCFDCMEPGLQQTMLLTLLQQIQVATIDAARTTTSTGGLLSAEHLHVKFGTGATASDYHYVLQSAANVGVAGSSLTFEGYTGAISVAPVAGNPSYTFAEFI